MPDASFEYTNDNIARKQKKNLKKITKNHSHFSPQDRASIFLDYCVLNKWVHGSVQGNFLRQTKHNFSFFIFSKAIRLLLTPVKLEQYRQSLYYLALYVVQLHYPSDFIGTFDTRSKVQEWRRGRMKHKWSILKKIDLLIYLCFLSR